MTEKQASKKEHSSAQEAKFHSFKQAFKEKLLLHSRAQVLLGYSTRQGRELGVLRPQNGLRPDPPMSSQRAAL